MLTPARAACSRDQSSLRGVRREWQRSAWFKKVPFAGAGEPPAPPRPPPRARAVRRAGAGAGAQAAAATTHADAAEARPWRVSAGAQHRVAGAVTDDESESESDSN
jgi:hypothetical protein